jgi:membrane protein
MISLTRLVIRRARQERLPQAAGSLTFSTLLSVVPLLAVSFALFTRFPDLQPLRGRARGAPAEEPAAGRDRAHGAAVLHQFAANAGGLTWAGSLFLLAAAMACC